VRRLSLTWICFIGGSILGLLYGIYLMIFEQGGPGSVLNFPLVGALFGVLVAMAIRQVLRVARLRR
jgi:hypothetical protein